jgi:hypothetical protein
VESDRLSWRVWDIYCFPNDESHSTVDVLDVNEAAGVRGRGRIMLHVEVLQHHCGATTNGLRDHEATKASRQRSNTSRIHERSSDDIRAIHLTKIEPNRTSYDDGQNGNSYYSQQWPSWGIDLSPSMQPEKRLSTHTSILRDCTYGPKTPSPSSLS